MANAFKVKTKMIYNPLNLIEIKKKALEKIDLRFIKKRHINIINIGRLTDQKNQILILKAIKMLSKNIKINLVIIGYGNKKNNLNMFIKNNKLSNRVTIIKEIDNPYKYIAKFDLFILSSKYEGLPNVLLECLALKIPIISTNCPTGPYEILNNNKYGTLFRVGDYEELSRLILKFKNKRKNFIKKTISGYNSLKRFNYFVNCNKYLKEINNLF